MLGVIQHYNAKMAQKNNSGVKQGFAHFPSALARASDRSWKKSQILHDFQGQICGKTGQFHANFWG